MYIAFNICCLAFRLAMVQMAVGKDKARNVQNACQLIRNAAQKGANMVVLPVRHHVTKIIHHCSELGSFRV